MYFSVFFLILWWCWWWCGLRLLSNDSNLRWQQPTHTHPNDVCVRAQLCDRSVGSAARSARSAFVCVARALLWPPGGCLRCRVLLRVRMLYYLKQEVIGAQFQSVLDGADTRWAPLLLPYAILSSAQNSPQTPYGRLPAGDDRCCCCCTCSLCTCFHWFTSRVVVISVFLVFTLTWEVCGTMMWINWIGSIK